MVGYFGAIQIPGAVIPPIPPSLLQQLEAAQAGGGPVMYFGTPPQSAGSNPTPPEGPSPQGPSPQGGLHGAPPPQYVYPGAAPQYTWPTRCPPQFTWPGYSTRPPPQAGVYGGPLPQAGWPPLPRPPPGGSTQPQQGDPVWDQWADSHSAHQGEP
ncbi:proline-rich proteoglycan 2-like [Sorghum bicolor]|uniref:proline-rich proteoglycan 2-like n=1 Tax=Sorghum bicolor TaxID=4558 RepID=UPI000B426D0E|nr:proline-rich proteoglycan 2-like [Sorghum bicolor]|eukprot:XP_021317477.1 proline-rich proteoglycan 2-like [Sorghum bicolor]